MKHRNRFNRHQRNGEPMTPFQVQPQQVQQVPAMNFAAVEDYVFNMGSIVAIDITTFQQPPNPGEEHTPEQAERYENRHITLYLVYGVSHVFKARTADSFWRWFLQISGTARVQN